MSNEIAWAIGIGFFFAFLSIGIISMNAEKFQLCNVSFEGEFTGNIDANQEWNEVINEFNIKSAKGKISVTVPCELYKQARGD